MSLTVKPDTCYAFAWANGRIQIGRRLPDNAMPLAKGPRQALFQLITPRAVMDSTGLRVPTVDSTMDHLEVVEAIASWGDRLARHNDHPEITLI